MSVCLFAASALVASLFTDFQAPPPAARPWTYWFVLNTLTDRETIEADFADIASLGFGGVLTTDSRAYHVDDDHLMCPPATIRWGGEAWQETMAVAVRAAAKHGVRFTLNIAASGGHLRGDSDAGGDNPKHLVCRRYRPGEPFEQPASPHYRDIAVFAVRTAGTAPTSGWYSGGDGIVSSAAARRNRLDAGGADVCAALEARELASAAEGASLGSDWCVVRFGYDIIPNAPEDIDVLDPQAVRRHLDRTVGALYDRVRDHAGEGKTFCGVYNVSWEGVMPTWSPTFEADYARLAGGSIRSELPLLAGFTLPGHDVAAVLRAYRHARGRMMAANFYGTVRTWAHERGLFAYSESGGPWPRTPDVFGECDQIEFLTANDFPQGEFWPSGAPHVQPLSGHANVGGRYLTRGIVSAAHVSGAKYASAEAFTHMFRHWSVDPGFLKPIGDQAFADGINLLVWHTYTSSPARFGVPGFEYFAGSHINRNVTWHDELPAFVTYLSRCQSVLQAGEPVVDVLVVGDDRPYCHWSKSPDFNGKGGNGRFRSVVSDEAKLAVEIPSGYLHDFTSAGVYAAKRAELDARYPVVVSATEGKALPARLQEKGIKPDVIVTPGTWTWYHRRTSEGDFYFIAGEGDGTLSFRCTAPAVELWHPVDGSREAVGTTVRDGRTEMKLTLPVGGSVVVAFLKEAPKVRAAERPALACAQELKGPWQVSFAYPKGIAAEPPAPVTLEALVDFTTREDLKHFAGTATYRQTFDYAGETRGAVLSLGTVPSGLAHVYLNGIDCGTVWCAPWTADVSKAIRKGANELEIRAVNNWYNRLVGDCLLPEDARVTRSNLHYWQVPRKPDPERAWRTIPTICSGYCPNDPLQSSGLLGPVRVLSPEAAASARVASLFTDFQSPPPAARPWCYWYWVNGNVDEETMTADLEAMKRVGFGGLLLLDPRGYDKRVWKPEPKMDFAGPEWVKAVGFAARECARLGLEFTINLSDCGGSLKGPWLTGEDGPKRLVCGVDVEEVPSDYEHYHDICRQEVWVAGDAAVKSGWRNAGGVTGRWERDAVAADVTTVPATTPGAKKVSLRFGYCLIPKREHDVDVIDPAAVERHFNRIVEPLVQEMGDLVGKTWTHVYSVSWEGAIPTWTSTFEAQFSRYTGYEIRPFLPELAGFVPAQGRRVLQDYRRVRNLMFKDDFYGTVRRLAHARGLKLFSESGGPWSRDPSVFLEADQLAFLGVNDMPQGEFWPVKPSHHSELAHNRPAANAAHIYGLPRASTEAFTHMSYHYSMWPERLKRSADCAFVDGINHFVWHTFTCSPKAFGKPGIEYFAGTHVNRNVTWFEESPAFISYLSRCQLLLQAGKPVTDIAVYAGKTPYQHWGRYRNMPWDGSRVAIPRGYNYDLLNDETLAKKADYPVFVDGTADTIVWPKLPVPDFEGDFDQIVHRRMDDGTDIYFVITQDKGRGAVTFRVTDKVAEIWNPITGMRRLATEAQTVADGRIRIPFSFTDDGSTFVVFRPKSAAAADPAPKSDMPKRHKPVAMPSETWCVDIGGKSYGRLGDWTKSDDPAVRYFAGRAYYRSSFELASVSDDRQLWLGRICGGVGRVLVNGVDCGVVWCQPYSVRVPAKVLRVGRNDIEVQVVNTWRNRLIGDCLLPASERMTRGCQSYNPLAHNNVFGREGHGEWTAGYSANDTLEPSGLYGPVELW